MRFMRLGIWLVGAVLATAGVALAQSTTGTISGRVVDTQERTVPGVTVSVESPNLQGIRTAVTSENGDYIFTLLPPGPYTVTFELSGFERVQRTAAVAPTQNVPVDVTMGLAGVAETVEVVGRAADVFTQTAQVATNFPQELIANLPTTRDINSTLLLAPAVHSTGPGGNYSIAGSMSYENLFMVNGVSVNENIRGTAFNLYIEDAIQETTISTAGVSAEYGRFGGGVVNVITKSGGNTFSGSFRDTLNNDNWRTLVPSRPGDIYTGDTKLDKIVPTYEYTVGGPILRDHLWFFTAGRFQTQESSRNLVLTNIPYIFQNKSQRYEGNATYSLNSSHRFNGSFIKEKLDQINDTFSTSSSMDLRSLYDRSTPQDISTISYSGVLSPTLFLEARFSKRNFTFVGSGAPTTDIVEGTLLIDNTSQRRYWSPTFCGVCTQEERDNEDVYVKGSYFLSSPKYGSHNMVVGYDNFNDIRKANNRQSGSDYRIYASNTLLQGTDVFPVFLGDGTTIIQWNPIPILSEGSNFRTHSVFFNDSWRPTNRLTANLGVRFDKNSGKNQAGELVAKDSAFSPRLGVIWDPKGTGEWSVTASYAKYVAPVSNPIADASSAAGNPQQWQYLYRGPNINAGGATTGTADAISQLWSWFRSTSGCDPIAQTQTCQPGLPVNGNPTLPGVAQRIGEDLATPSNIEYATGVSRQFGGRASMRADYVYRHYQDFYVARLDQSTGRVKNSAGQEFDLTIIENDKDDIYKRNYQGLTAQATYRFGSRTDVGGTYTLSHAWGNIDGENVASGPLTGGAYTYPEYIQESWNYPEGDLVIDQRHRARLWINYGVPRVSGLTLSLLQALESGVPYGAGGLPIQGGNANGVNVAPYIDNPGYVAEPAGSATAYFYTARDAFRTEGQKRTDFAANYQYNIGAGGKQYGLFVSAQIINLFNQFDLCACGSVNVFANPGAPGSGAGLQSIDRTVRTPVNAATTVTQFNPFTQTPVEGVNWIKGPNFGHAQTRYAYTTPRTFRLTFGVRF
jgi:outer membrane receptor for ferrienterochelin and colicin